MRAVAEVFSSQRIGKGFTLNVWEAVFLGMVQGLTEFLPVSSSGHLVLAEHLLNIHAPGDVTFEVFVHFGTLLSVVAVFWKDVRNIILSLIEGVTQRKVIRKYYRENEPFRLAAGIAVGSIPAALIGLFYEEQITDAFGDPKLVSTMLIVTGLILFLTRVARPSRGRQIGMGTAFIIGCAQAFAIIPGISRSGSTISAALYLKVGPVHAAKFSFLLSLPVIFGATVLKTKHLFDAGEIAVGFLPLMAGTVVAFVSGYGAIKLLLRVVERGKFGWFALYCFVVGILGIMFI